MKGRVLSVRSVASSLPKHYFNALAFELFNQRPNPSARESAPLNATEVCNCRSHRPLLLGSGAPLSMRRTLVLTGPPLRLLHLLRLQVVLRLVPPY